MRLATLAFLITSATTPAAAQRRAAAQDDDTPQASAPVPPEDCSVTEHTIRLGGATVPYRAIAGEYRCARPAGGGSRADSGGKHRPSC
jgi:hypothetical protein